MKTKLIIFLLLVTLNCLSQKRYNTKIEQANTVVIKKGKAEIKNVKNVTIGNITLINQKPKYYFSNLIREKDSTGLYITKIELVNIDPELNTFLKFRLDFNDNVESVKTNNFAGTNSSEQLNGNWYQFSCSINPQEEPVYVTIKSKTPVFITITGVSPKKD